jgi:LysM repeat protein
MVSRYSVFLILAACILTSITQPAFAEKPLRLFFEKTVQTVKRPDHQEYVIKEGDWLIRVLRAQGYSDTEIQKLLPVVREMNPDIADLNKLRPGQILQLPNQTPSLKIRPAVRSDVSKKKLYTVKAGDTLASIFRREGVPEELIFKDYLGLFLELNPHVPNADTLRIGQEITLPLRHSAQPAVAATVPEKTPSQVAVAPSAPTEPKRQTGQAGQGEGSATGAGSLDRSQGGQGGERPSPFGTKLRSPVKTVQPRPSAVDRVMTDNATQEEKKEPVTGLPFIRTVMEQMRFRFTPGQELLYPLPRGGWLHINLEDSPLLDTPWGGRVILSTTPKNEEWVADADALGMQVCSVSPNWFLPEVLEKIAAAYPQEFRLWGRDRDLVIHQNGLSITLKGPQLVVLEQSSGKFVFMLWPRETIAEPSLPQGLPEVLGRARIKIIELDTYNQLSRLPARPRGSTYVPIATRADLLLAMGIKNPDGENPKNLAELLQILRRKERLHRGMARAAWYSGQKSLAVQVPAWLIAPDNKIILLDNRFNDEFLISILTQAGYSCFILPS